jgi:hypothetical protein
MAREFRIFISHSWGYSEDLDSLTSLLNRRPYFHASFEEASRHTPINSTNAFYIKTRLANKIAQSNIILALAGIYASHSEWMQWELDKALELKIPIVGVVPRGQLRVSQTVSSRAIGIARWNTESIVQAIRTHALW